jgi:phosphate starvation-inducible PhoH-like protein
LNELTLELTDINPRDFFGDRNTNINLLKKSFPKLKIVARGSKIKVYGDAPGLEDFEKRFGMLTEHYSRYNKLDENAIERILSSESEAEMHSSEKSNDVLVHGVSGRLVKAQTVNQRRLVDAVLKNDMVFAIGPAGTGKTYTGVALAVRLADLPEDAAGPPPPALVFAGRTLAPEDVARVLEEGRETAAELFEVLRP